MKTGRVDKPEQILPKAAPGIKVCADAGRRSPRQPHPNKTRLCRQDISFREWAPGHFIDWHPAPRRQYIISLSGTIEIGLEDGSTHRFVPGDARLVEDTTGKGHTTLVPGDEPSITAVIPLAYSLHRRYTGDEARIQVDR